MEQLQAALAMFTGVAETTAPGTPPGGTYATGGVGRRGSVGAAWEQLTEGPLKLPEAQSSIDLAVCN